MSENKIVEVLINKLEAECNFNILEKTRKRSYIEARSALYYVLNKEYGFTTQYISDLFDSKGYYYERSNITYSINNFKTYCDFSPFCKNLYLKITNDSIFFNDIAREKSELELFLSKIDVSLHLDLLETVKLKVKSYEWKSKDSCQIIESSDGISTLAY